MRWGRLRALCERLNGEHLRAPYAKRGKGRDTLSAAEKHTVWDSPANAIARCEMLTLKISMWGVHMLWRARYVESECAGGPMPKLCPSWDL